MSERCGGCGRSDGGHPKHCPNYREEEASYDLSGQPITMWSLHMILNTICGVERAVIKNARREMAAEVMHRLELSIIAAHEARVRQARERNAVV